MNNPLADSNLVFDSAALLERMIAALSKHCGLDILFRNEGCRYGERTSSVLLLLGEISPEEGGTPEACVILNKRSKEVKQPGDLCCPGGAVEKLDHFLARLLSFRGSSLSKWPCWHEVKKEQKENAQFLSLLYAAGLREAWEEMGINPFGLVFLGPLPTQSLVLFRRSIHPIVAWISSQKRFRLSWEVERIVKFPLHALLNPFNYALYRRYIPPHLEWRFSSLPPHDHSDIPRLAEAGGRELKGKTADFPCFIYKTKGQAEVLWGVTFRIVTLFLEMTFGFQIPDIEKLPVVPATLDEEYVIGRTRNSANQNNL